MKRLINILFATAITFIALPTSAQEYLQIVSLESDNGTQGVFTSAGIGEKKKDVEVNAIKSLFHTLFFQGVEGVADGKPLVAKPNPPYTNSFFNDMARYSSYVVSTEETVKSKKIGNNFQGTFKITLRLRQLVNDVRKNTHYDELMAEQPEVKLPNPTIIVVPYKKEGESYQAILENNYDVRIAVSAVQRGFEDCGIKTIDLQARLDRAKLAISRLVDRLRDDRIGLIVFAGSSFVQLPITTDYVSAKMFLNSISTESVPIQGTAMGDAINTAIRSFSAQSEKSRAIIVITDGENHEDDPVAAAKQAFDMGIRVYTIGVGSPEGEPIPMDGGLLKDKDGNIVVTKLDEKTLREIANAGGGVYVKAGNSEFGLNPIVDSIKKMDEEQFSSVVFEEFDEQYMYFFAIALVFFIIEMLIGERRSKRHLFN